MWFRQLVHREGESIAYLVACSVTHQAVLVDPVPGAEPRYRNLLAEHGLKLAYVLETTALPGRSQEHAPYASLLAELGLSADDAPETSSATDERFGCPRIGPVARWAPDPDDPSAAAPVQVVEVGGTIVELTVCGTNPPGPEALVIGGGRAARALRLRFDRIGVRIGEITIEAWATGVTENGLAYVLQDRAITGTALLTHAPEGSPVTGRTPHALLSLSGDALLFPRGAPEDVFVATVHQERLWRTRLSGAREAHNERRWQPVVHQGGTG